MNGIKHIAAILSLSMLLSAVCATYGCTSNPTDAPTETSDQITIVIPTKVVNMARQSLDDLLADLKAVGEEHCASIDARGTEGVDHEVVIIMPASERQWWLDTTAGYVREVVDSFSNLGEKYSQEGYRVQVSDDFTHEDYYYNLEADPDEDIFPHLAASEYYCVMWQLLAGDGDGAYSITTTVHNCNTGKVVATATTSSEGGTGDLEYDASDWVRSN